jgi:hypothetical protein
MNGTPPQPEPQTDPLKTCVMDLDKIKIRFENKNLKQKLRTGDFAK